MQGQTQPNCLKQNSCLEMCNSLPSEVRERYFFSFALLHTFCILLYFILQVQWGAASKLYSCLFSVCVGFSKNSSASGFPEKCHCLCCNYIMLFVVPFYKGKILINLKKAIIPYSDIIWKCRPNDHMSIRYHSSICFCVVQNLVTNVTR